MAMTVSFFTMGAYGQEFPCSPVARTIAASTIATSTIATTRISSGVGISGRGISFLVGNK